MRTFWASIKRLAGNVLVQISGAVLFAWWAFRIVSDVRDAIGFQELIITRWNDLIAFGKGPYFPWALAASVLLLLGAGVRDVKRKMDVDEFKRRSFEDQIISKAEGKLSAMVEYIVANETRMNLETSFKKLRNYKEDILKLPAVFEKSYDERPERTAVRIMDASRTMNEKISSWEHEARQVFAELGGDWEAALKPDDLSIRQEEPPGCERITNERLRYEYQRWAWTERKLEAELQKLQNASLDLHKIKTRIMGSA
jgi:hypothetical protein